MNSIENEIKRISDPSIWRRTHKKSYEVWVCKPRLGRMVQNKFEGTIYETNTNEQFVISGTAGEKWIISIDKLMKTYTFADGTPITIDTLMSKRTEQSLIDWIKIKTRPNAVTNWAVILDRNVINFPVKTSWGSTLLANRPEVEHGIGDVVVCADDGCGRPNFLDAWVVNGEIFPKTYDLHSFPNVFPKKKLSNQELQKPKSLVFV